MNRHSRDITTNAAGRSVVEFASGARLVPLMNPERAVTLAELEL
jgi:hypothetical protein